MAAMSEETTKVLAAEVSEDGRTANDDVETASAEKEFNSENIVDFTSRNSVVENGSPAKKGEKSCRPRPGNVFCSKTNENDIAANSDEGVDHLIYTTSENNEGSGVENFPVGFEVSDIIKEALKQKVIEIVHRNTVKSVSVPAATSQPMIRDSAKDRESYSRIESRQNTSGTQKQSDVSFQTDVSHSQKMIPSGGNGFYVVATNDTNEQSTNILVNSTSARTSSRTPIMINTPSIVTEASNETKRPKLGTVTVPPNDRPSCRSNSGHSTRKLDQSEGGSSEQQRKTLPSIYSLTHLCESQAQAEELDQTVRSNIQEETSMDNSLRASTLFDIDNLISSAPVGDSPPSLDQISDVQPLPSSGTSLDRNNESSAMLSNVFSISSLTDESKQPTNMPPLKDPKSSRKQQQQQNDNATSHAVLPVPGQMMPRHENTANVKPLKHTSANGRSSHSNGSASKSATHSVEYLMSSAIRTGNSNSSFSSETCYNYGNGKELPSQRNDFLIRLENTASYPLETSSSQDFRKRLPSTANNSFRTTSQDVESVFTGETGKSTKRAKPYTGNATEFKHSAVSLKGPPASKAPEPHAPANWTPYTPNQVVAGPAQLPFWEENMVVMPPQRLCAFQSQNGEPQSYSGGVNLHIENASVNPISAYGANNMYNSQLSNDIIPANSATTNVETQRPGQNFILSPFSQNTADPGSEAGKYALQNRTSFNNTLNQTLPTSFQYNNVSAQYPLEPQMLLQPLSSSEKWSMSNRNSSFSGFKDVDFMASNNTSYFPSGFTGASNPNVFNPFFDGYNAQNFNEQPSAANVQYNTYPNLSSKSRTNSTAQSHRVDKQPQLQSRATSNNIASNNASSFPANHKLSSSTNQQQPGPSNQSSQPTGPRHLIKNFVQTKHTPTPHNNSTAVEKPSGTMGNEESSFDPNLNSRYQGSNSWVMPPPPPVDSFYAQTSNQFLLPNSDLAFSQNFL